MQRILKALTGTNGVKTKRPYLQPEEDANNPELSPEDCHQRRRRTTLHAETETETQTQMLKVKQHTDLLSPNWPRSMKHQWNTPWPCTLNTVVNWQEMETWKKKVQYCMTDRYTKEILFTSLTMLWELDVYPQSMRVDSLYCLSNYCLSNYCLYCLSNYCLVYPFYK